MAAFLKRIESWFADLFQTSGGMVLLAGRCIMDVRFLPRDRKRFMQRVGEVGWHTLPIAALIGVFTGMITSLQTGTELKELGLQQSIGSIVGLSLVREMGPVFTAFIVAARVGAAWAAEIGTMEVSEETDALRSLGIHPVRYLAMPRFFAAMIMLPLLTVYSVVIGIAGGALVSVYYLGVSYRIYSNRMFNSLVIEDLGLGLFKAFVFGILIALVSSYTGLSTKNGAQGVGRSTMRSVVISFSLILIADYFITRFW